MPSQATPGLLRDQQRIEMDSLSLVPGPTELPEPFSSLDLQELVEYPSQRVASVLDSIAVRSDPRSLDPFQWKWRWSSGNDWIEIRFTTLDGGDAESSIWGGSGLRMNCAPASLLGVWNQLRAELPAVWLHDGDCQMYRPESFVQRWDARLRSGQL